jgi:hypothetical protein
VTRSAVGLPADVRHGPRWWVELTTVPSALRAATSLSSKRTHSVSRSACAAPTWLVSMAVHHGVAGYVRLAAERSADPSALVALDRAGLGDICRTQFARHVQLSSELLALGDRLTQSRIPWAAMKGPVVSEELHRRPDLRSAVDLDILVAPERLGEAIRALQDGGCRLLERNWPLARAVRPGQLHLRSPAGTTIDLHWQVIHSQRARRGSASLTEDLLARTRVAQLPGGGVPTLDEVDTVAHLCVHAAQSGGDRLIWLVDIDRALARTSVDQVADRALELRVGPMVEVMLRRCRGVLGTPVPDRYLRRLVSEPAWRVVSAASALLPQVHRARGGGSVARLVARAARSDARTSLRETASRAAAWLGHGTTAATSGTRDLWDPHDPESMFFDVGEPDGLDTFVAAVVAESQASAVRRSRSSAAASSGSE